MTRFMGLAIALISSSIVVFCLTTPLGWFSVMGSILGMVIFAMGITFLVTGD